MAKPKPKPAPVVEAPPPKPTRPLDNGEKAAFEATCAKARVFLCEAMLAAPIGPEKTRAKDAYVAFAEVAITAKAGRGWEAGLADQLVDMQMTIDRVKAANREAVTKFGGLHDDMAHLDDQPDMIVTLLNKLAEAERDLQDAMKTRPAFVRMSAPLVAPAKAVKHEVDLGPLNEAPPMVRRRPRPARA